MPTVLIERGYRLFFYSNERAEPPHVNVRHAGREAKIWLHDLSIAINIGYASREMTTILSIVRENREKLTQAWNEHFDR